MIQWANFLAWVSSLDVDSTHIEIQNGVQNDRQKVNFTDSPCKRGKL